MDLANTKFLIRVMSIIVATSAVGCGATARLTVADGTGPNPVLPEPRRSLLPMVNVVTAKGWAGDEKPIVAEGMTVVACARELDHPRWLHVLPNGDVLVAETNAPVRPKYAMGIKGWFFKRFQKKAGGATPTANRITLLRDADGDGVAEVRSVFVAGLDSPFGMALVGDVLYVANSDAVVRAPYTVGRTQITATPTKLVDLPAGAINQHWTRNLIASPDGTKLYVAVGSASSVAEHGRKEEEGRAAIWEIDARTGSTESLRRGFGIQSEWRGTPTAQRYGRSSTSATSLAAIWCPTT